MCLAGHSNSVSFLSLIPCNMYMYISLVVKKKYDKMPGLELLLQELSMCRNTDCHLFAVFLY